MASTNAGATTTRTVSLSLHGGTSGPAGRSCGVSPHWRYYEVGGTVRFSGHVAPAPAAGTVAKVFIRRCSSSRFTVVKTQTARVRAGGGFSGYFVVHARSDCYVQAVFAGRASPRAYFRVR